MITMTDNNRFFSSDEKRVIAYYEMAQMCAEDTLPESECDVFYALTRWFWNLSGEQRLRWDLWMKTNLNGS